MVTRVEQAGDPKVAPSSDTAEATGEAGEHDDRPQIQVVFAETGAGAGGAVVQISPLCPSTDSSHIVDVTCDDNGRVRELPHLEDEVILQAFHDDQRSELVRFRTGSELVLRISATVLTQVWVVDADGRELKGARVRVLIAPFVTQAHPCQPPRTEHDPNSLNLQLAAHETVRVIASAPGYQRASQLARADEGLIIVALRRGRVLTVSLDGACTELAEATFFASTPLGLTRRPMARGRHAGVFHADDLPALGGWIVVDPGPPHARSVVPADLELQEVLATVVDEGGTVEVILNSRPDSERSVMLLCGDAMIDQRSLAPNTTGVGLQVRFERLAPGNYVVRVLDNDGVQRDESVIVSPGQTCTVDARTTTHLIGRGEEPR